MLVKFPLKTSLNEKALGEHMPHIYNQRGAYVLLMLFHLRMFLEEMLQATYGTWIGTIVLKCVKVKLCLYELIILLRKKKLPDHQHYLFYY